MRIKKLSELNNFSILLIIILFTISFIATSEISSAILVSSYCRLSIQSMQLQVTHLNDLITVINQYQDDQTTQAQQIAAKQAEYDQALTSIYSSFGTTTNEYVTYLGKHNQEVTAYLQANPDIKQQMDTLTSQIHTLLTQYESLKGYKGEKPKEEPPLP